jgi:hypothetical protein
VVRALTETQGFVVVGVFSALATLAGVVIATRAKRQATEVSAAAASIDSALEGYAGLVTELRTEVERGLTRITRLEAYREADRVEIEKCHEDRDLLAERVRVLERNR